MRTELAGSLLAHPPRHLFFTGKGGVGKTSLACATAIGLADTGKRVLLVSTDPASNLDEVLSTPLDRAPRLVADVPGLAALNIDPEAAAQAYREKVVAPLRGQLPEVALRSIEEQLSGACTTEIAAFDEFARLIGEPAEAAAFRLPQTLCPSDLVDEITAAGNGVILTMGKGGVGKTTAAAGLAVALATRGRRVHLTTTDPAANVATTLGGEMPGLTVSRIDPAVETAAYVDQVLRDQGKALDADGRALLEEDLRSPCTEEIAVFRAFAREVDRGRDGFVVLDTAPTGHTLLLLDATQAYHRELGRQARDTIPLEVRDLLPRLRDPAFCRILIVTLPEATPVHEAAALQEDLRRAEIEPFAWVINQSLALTPTTDPLLIKRARNEVRFFEEVTRSHSRRTVALPWLVEEPVGLAPLGRLFSQQPETPMPKYVYETVPQSEGEQPDYLEIEQAADAEALTQHPETGRPVRRVVVAGVGDLSSNADDEEGCCSGSSGCCP